MTEHYMIARTPPGNPYRRLCVCGAKWWWPYYKSCDSLMRHDESGQILYSTTAKMSKWRFEERFRSHYTPILGAKMVADILDMAKSVESGYEFEYIMSPYAEDMFGAAVDAIW